MVYQWSWFGTAALTSLGMGVEEMKVIAEVIHLVLSNTEATTIETGKNAGNKSKAKYTFEA